MKEATSKKKKPERGPNAEEPPDKKSKMTDQSINPNGEQAMPPYPGPPPPPDANYAYSPWMSQGYPPMPPSGAYPPSYPGYPPTYPGYGAYPGAYPGY